MLSSIQRIYASSATFSRKLLIYNIEVYHQSLVP